MKHFITIEEAYEAGYRIFEKHPKVHTGWLGSTPAWLSSTIVWSRWVELDTNRQIGHDFIFAGDAIALSVLNKGLLNLSKTLSEISDTRKQHLEAKEALAKVKVTKAAVSAATAIRPDHYGGEDNPYETIKVIGAWKLDFLLGNAVKYISRAGKKGSAVEDLEKAKQYLDWKIAELKKV